MEHIALTFGFNKEWGSKNTLYKTNNIDNIENNWLSLSWQPSKFLNGYFFRAEWVYNFVNYLQNLKDGLAFAPYGWENLHNFSHGQQFMKIFEAQMDTVWFYILDEIESALSPANQLKIVEIIKYMVSQWSQFLIASHSPIILSIQEESQILSFDNDVIKEITYDNVPCVDMYRRILKV
jgi:predicted ATPase